MGYSVVALCVGRAFRLVNGTGGVADDRPINGGGGGNRVLLQVGWPRECGVRLRVQFLRSEVVFAVEGGMSGLGIWGKLS